MSQWKPIITSAIYLCGFVQSLFAEIPNETIASERTANNVLAAFANEATTPQHLTIEGVLNRLAMDKTLGEVLRKQFVPAQQKPFDLTNIPLPNWSMDGFNFQVTSMVAAPRQYVRSLIFTAKGPECFDATPIIHRLAAVEWPEMVQREREYPSVRWDAPGEFGGAQILTKRNATGADCLISLTFSYFPTSRD